MFIHGRNRLFNNINGIHFIHLYGLYGFLLNVIEYSNTRFYII